MVRVDMSVARAAITKRQRRRRRAATRLLARQCREEREELAAAEHARHARRMSVAAWLVHDATLTRHRQPPNVARNDREKELVRTPPKRRRSVTFADDVLVTEIPAAADEALPKPVSSPIGVALTDGAIAKETLRERLTAVGNRGLPRSGRYLVFGDDWSDGTDDEEHDPEFMPEPGADVDAGQRMSRTTRRIRSTSVASRLGSPQGQATHGARGSPGPDAVFSALGGSRISDDEFAAIFKASAKDAQRFAATFKELNTADRNERNDTR